MESRKAYFIDLAQIITFLFCLFACLSGGTLGTLGFLLYLFIRGVVELMYARDFRAVSSTALEHASYDNDKILQHIYSENHDVLGSHIDQRKFIEIVLPAMQARKIPQEDITNLRKNGQEIVFLNRLSFVVSTFGIILAGYLMIAPKILHLIHPPDERFAEALYQVPIILVVYFVFMIQGVVHVYTANTHVRHSNLTKGLL